MRWQNRRETMPLRALEVEKRIAILKNLVTKGLPGPLARGRFATSLISALTPLSAIFLRRIATKEISANPQESG